MRYRNVKTGIEFTSSSRIAGEDIIALESSPDTKQEPVVPKTEAIMPEPIEPETPKKASKPVKRSRK